MASKRRLPVLKSQEEAAPRSAWEWIVFGAAMMIVAWLPMTGVALLIVAQLGEGGKDRTAGSWVGPLVMPGVAMVLAFLGAAYVLGRWGRRTPREAAAAATLANLLGVGLTWARFGFVWEALATLLIAVPAAVLGARLGGRRRGSIPPA